MPRAWKQRDDEIACVWLMTLDDVADYLERTPREILQRLRELGALNAGPRLPPAADDIPEFSPLPVNVTKKILKLEEIVPPHERGAEAMDAEGAEKIGRRVMTHLYRGSIDHAREAIEDAWRDHLAALKELPFGMKLLDEPLSRVIDDQRTLDGLERAGLSKVEHLLQADRLELLSISNFGDATVTKLVNLSAGLRGRAFPSNEAQSRAEKSAPRKIAQCAVRNHDPAMQQFWERETLRLLPLIEKLARRSKIPIPIEDLVQEGAIAVFKALPSWNPNFEGCDGRPAKIESWLSRRIVGAFQDHARRSKFLRGGGRSRQETRFSLDDQAHEDDAGNPVSFADMLVAPEDARQWRSAEDWIPLLEGLPPRSQAILLEYFVRGQPQAKIAQMLGISESRVSQILSETLEDLEALDRLDGRVRKICC